MLVKRITIRSWNEIVELQEKGWIYRGQQDVTWLLETILERYVHRLNGNLKRHALKIEGCLLREFMRRFHHYADYRPRENDELEWFALMQHHGAPSRLLDWTMSIYVAAYFAVEKAESDCAVWAINLDWLHECCDSRGLPGITGLVEDDDIRPRIDRINKEKYCSFEELFGGVKLGIAPANPFRLNERLTIQKGIFLCPGDISESFWKNLLAFKPDHRYVKKIVIQQRHHPEFIEKLAYMNIDRATLFPGLDGFAVSLGVYQPHVQAVIHGDPRLQNNLRRYL
jgi:hypothetical protein